MSFGFNYTYEYYPLFVARNITNSDSISSNFTITLYPHWFKQITLEWSIPADWGSCRFNIYKADTENGPFKKLNATPLGTATNNFKDTTTENYSKFNKSWYIVEAVLASGKRIQSPATTWGILRTPWVELRAQEIQRREWILLDKFVGSEVYVLRRKTYGQRCSNCWNFDLEKITKDKCTVCFGTSFEGGYFPAVDTKMQFDADPREVQFTYFGRWELNELFAWTIALPHMKARDLIYRAKDAALFEIMDRKETALQSVAVRQLLKIIQLDKESPEYKTVIANDLIPEAYQ